MRTSTRYLAVAIVLAFTIGLAACQSGGSDTASDSPPADATEVQARDVQFQPQAIQVKPGTTVTWSFEDGAVRHDVKGDGFSSPTMKSGTFTHRFDKAGTYEFHCTLHANMTGRVVVTG
jgi:plastocyanin